MVVPKEDHQPFWWTNWTKVKQNLLDQDQFAASRYVKIKLIDNQVGVKFCLNLENDVRNAVWKDDFNHTKHLQEIGHQTKYR